MHLSIIPEDVSKAMRAEWHSKIMGTLDGTAHDASRFYLSSAAERALARVIMLLGQSSKVIKLQPNHALYPGFTDAHAHVIENGYMLELPLVETRSLEDIVKALEEYILAHPDMQNDKGRWIEGMGWDQTKWNGGEGAEFPTAVSGQLPPPCRERCLPLGRKTWTGLPFSKGDQSL